MKLSAPLLIALGTIASAEAQTSSTPPSYFPVPTELLKAIADSPGLAEDGADMAASIRASISKPGSEEDPVAGGLILPMDDPAAPGGHSSAPVRILPESLSAEPALAPSSAVTVTVNGVKSAVGTIYVAICDKGLREGCSYKAHTAAAPGSVEVTLNNIPPGQYAVVGFHDKNDNGEFDKFLGVPREPYALSGSAGGEFVPRFNDALVTLASGDNAVTIGLKTLGR